MRTHQLIINTLILSILTITALSAEARNKHHLKNSDCSYLDGKNGDTTGNGNANGENGKNGVAGTSCLSGGSGGNGGNTNNGNANGGNGGNGANG